jgi:hypothetical protein
MYVGNGTVVDCLNEQYGCHSWDMGSAIYSYYVQTFDHGQSMKGERGRERGKERKREELGKSRMSEEGG